jgi:hypothetical protein
MGKYIDFRPKLSARQLRQKAEQEARERQDAEDRGIMGELIAEEARRRAEAEIQRKADKESRRLAIAAPKIKARAFAETKARAFAESVKQIRQICKEDPRTVAFALYPDPSKEDGKNKFILWGEEFLKGIAQGGKSVEVKVNTFNFDTFEEAERVYLTLRTH